MGDFEAKGDEFAKKADKKLKSFSLFGSSTKYEDGAELLDKAANQYKLGKACKFDFKLETTPCDHVTSLFKQCVLCLTYDFCLHQALTTSTWSLSYPFIA
jgi:hypothetical protein